LWTQIRSLAAQGKTVLLTTHYLEEADALAHRIVVINKGKVVSEGTPQEVKGRFASRKIKCCTTLSTAQLWALPGVIDVEQIGSHTCITAGNAEAVLRKMLSYDQDLSELEVVSPGLEDAFLALTQN
jgi:ABC-2 type transport system ATP-binding protein